MSVAITLKRRERAVGAEEKRGRTVCNRCCRFLAGLEKGEISAASPALSMGRTDVSIVKVLLRLGVSSQQELRDAALKEPNGEKRIEVDGLLEVGDGLLVPAERRMDETDVEEDARGVSDLLEEKERAGQRVVEEERRKRSITYLEIGQREVEFLLVERFECVCPYLELLLERHGVVVGRREAGADVGAELVYVELCWVERWTCGWRDRQGSRCTSQSSVRSEREMLSEAGRGRRTEAGEGEQLKGHDRREQQSDCSYCLACSSCVSA